MGAFQNAIGTIGSQKCRVLFVGDSFLEGQGSSTWETRPVNKIVDLMRTRYGSSEQDGRPLHRYYNGGVGSESWANLGDVGGYNVRDETYAMSKRGMNLGGGGYWRTEPITGRYVEIYFMASTTMDQNEFLVLDATDMGNPVTLQTVANNVVDGIQRVVVDAGSISTRNWAVNTQTKTAYIDSITVTNTHPDSGPGFVSIDSTCSGIGSNAAVSGSALWAGWGQANPHLILDDLWHNDYMGAMNEPSVTNQRFKDRLARYREIRSDIDVAVLGMWVPPSVNPTEPNSLGYSFINYRDAIRQACWDTGARFCDLNDSGITQKSSWFRSDGVHLNDTGYDKAMVFIEEWIHDQYFDPTGWPVLMGDGSAALMFIKIDQNPGLKTPTQVIVL